MASNKIQWYGKIPSSATWLTFHDQTSKGYHYDNDRKSITASTSSNNGQITDDINFDIKENNGEKRETTVIFYQKNTGKKITYLIEQKSPPKKYIQKIM